jgi:toxin HigB-1
VIINFRSKSLQKLFEGGNGRGLPSEYLPKLRRTLFALDNATMSEDLEQPGFGMHALAGDMKGYFSIVISRNWRVIFRFDNSNVTDVDFVDYH